MRGRASSGTGETIDEEVFKRFADRLSYVQGDFGDAATYARVGEAIKSAKTPVFYLEIPPFLFGTVIKGLHDAGLTENARVVVEKPFGHDLASARELADDIHQYIHESQLYRIDHYLGKMGLQELLYLRFANTLARVDLESRARLVRADHDGRGLRRRGSRAFLRPRRRAPGRRGQPPHAAAGDGGDGAAGGGRCRHPEGRQVRAVPVHARGGPGPLRPRPV